MLDMPMLAMLFPTRIVTSRRRGSDLSADRIAAPGAPSSTSAPILCSPSEKTAISADAKNAEPRTRTTTARMPSAVTVPCGTSRSATTRPTGIGATTGRDLRPTEGPNV